MAVLLARPSSLLDKQIEQLSDRLRSHLQGYSAELEGFLKRHPNVDTAGKLLIRNQLSQDTAKLGTLALSLDHKWSDAEPAAATSS